MVIVVPTMQEMLAIMPQVGSVCWLGIRPTTRASVQTANRIEIDIANAIVGDHYAGRPGSKRQVTLIQQEHIEAVASILGKEVVPELLRRNIVVSGINLLAT